MRIRRYGVVGRGKKWSVYDYKIGDKVAGEQFRTMKETIKRCEKMNKGVKPIEV